MLTKIVQILWLLSSISLISLVSSCKDIDPIEYEQLILEDGACAGRMYLLSKDRIAPSGNAYSLPAERCRLIIGTDLENYELKNNWIQTARILLMGEK